MLDLKAIGPPEPKIEFPNIMVLALSIDKPGANKQSIQGILTGKTTIIPL